MLAAVTSGVALVFNFGFLEMGQLVFFPVRAQAQIINEIDDLAQVVTALNFYFSLRCNKIPSHGSLLYYLN